MERVTTTGQTLNLEQVSDLAKKRIEELLNDLDWYERYFLYRKDLESDKQAIIAEIKKIQRQKGSAPKEIVEKQIPINTEINLTEQELKQIGEGMKYDNPLVWMMYKFEAYKNGKLGVKPILTLKDLQDHCKPTAENPDYICTRRFDYLNSYLKKHKNIDLLSEDYKGKTDLGEIVKDEDIVGLTLDEDFMKGWRTNEYDDPDGKWQNYQNKESGLQPIKKPTISRFNLFPRK